MHGIATTEHERIIGITISSATIVADSHNPKMSMQVISISSFICTYIVDGTIHTFLEVNGFENGGVGAACVFAHGQLHHGFGTKKIGGGVLAPSFECYKSVLGRRSECDHVAYVVGYVVN